MTKNSFQNLASALTVVFLTLLSDNAAAFLLYDGNP